MSGDSIEATKKIIRSLLISAKHGLSMEQLNRDYRSQIGTPIPYFEHGHQNLEKFLFSIPDVVRISRRGRLLHLTGVPTSETSHIARMVQQQTGGTTSIVNTSDTKQSKYNYKLFMSNSGVRPRASPRVPSDICRQLREILLSYPNGIELGSLPHTYQKRFGHGLQYTRLGYSSIYQLIRAVPGVTTVILDRREYVIYSTFVARNLSPPFDTAPPGFSKYPTHPYIASPAKNDTVDLVEETAVPEEATALCEDPLSPEEELKPVPENVAETVEEQEPPPDDGTSPDPNQSPPSTPGTSVSRTLPPLPSTRPLNQAAQLVMHKQKQGQDMFDKLSREISDLLSRLPEVTPLKELEVAYQAKFGFELPYLEFGFSSTRELAESLWTVCSLEQREQGVFVRSLDKDKVQTSDPVPIENYSHGCPLVDPELGKRVRNLLLKWPSGMPLSLLRGKYKDAYQEELSVQELGFENVLCMMVSIQDCVRLTPWCQESGTTDYILHGVPLTSEELQGQVLPAPSKPAPCDDVIIPYEKQPVPQSWEFNVYLPFISNPDRFWIQVVGCRTTSVAEQMLEKMTHFYNNLSSASLPSFLLPAPKEGQNCAAPYQADGNFYRAKVLRILPPDLAEVYYVDYGNKARVPLASLRRIELSNMILPAQAIRCRLANVRPVEYNRWQPGSANKMKDLTNNLELLCKVQNVEPDDTLSVHLYSPGSDPCASINEALIACGIAVHEDNNTPLHPARACLSPEENIQMTSYPPPPPPPPPPQNPYPPPLHPMQVPFNPPPPGMMPAPPHPYHSLPFYNFPPPMGPPFPYMNTMVPMDPNHFIPPYTQPPTATPPYHRKYLTASASPQPPIRPTLNFHASSSASSKPVSLPDSSTLLQGDTYVFNDSDNQALERLVEEKRPILEKGDQFGLSPDMGPHEKVRKYLSSARSHEEIEADRAKLERLKHSRVELVNSKVDMSNRTEFNRYLSRLNTLSHQIEQLENRFTEVLTLGPGVPSQDVTPPSILNSTPSFLTGSIPQPILNQSLPPPVVSQAPPSPPVPQALTQLLALGAAQNMDTQGQRTQVKYKGIGRGGKMSDLV